MEKLRIFLRELICGILLWCFAIFVGIPIIFLVWVFSETDAEIENGKKAVG
jgi:hypothetical protein